MMSNERPKSTFTWIYAAGAIVLVLVPIFAVTSAIQDYNDRVLTDEITGIASELQDAGARIMNIRDADMKDMNDYIRAYSQMEPLLNDYDRQLQRITDVYTRPAKGTASSSLSSVPTVVLILRTGKACRRSLTSRYALENPALEKLALIVRAADVKGQEGAAPEGIGLRCIAQGFAALGISDEERLMRQFPIYDALYAYVQGK